MAPPVVGRLDINESVADPALISLATTVRASVTSVAPLSTRIAAWEVPLTVARITNVPPSTCLSPAGCVKASVRYH